MIIVLYVYIALDDEQLTSFVRKIVNEEVKVMQNEILKVKSAIKYDCVYILCKNYIPVGTCFAITEKHLLTTRHNIFDVNEDINTNTICQFTGDGFSTTTFTNRSNNTNITTIYRSARVIRGGKAVDVIQGDIQSKKLSEKEDWLVLEAEDFNFYKPLMIDLSVNVDAYIKMCYYLIKQSTNSGIVAEIKKSTNRISGLHNGNITCHDVATVSGGSCGGPYVSVSTQGAVGMHMIGGSLITESSNEHATTKLLDVISIYPIGLLFKENDELIKYLTELSCTFITNKINVGLHSNNK